MCFLVTLLPYWPYHEIFIIPKYILLFGPRWWLLFSVILIVVFWKSLSKKQLISSVVLFLLSLNYLGFQLPRISSYFSDSNDTDITIISANVGGGSINGINFIAKNLQPDFILLQEAGNIDLSKQFTGYSFKECLPGLCLISKYPFVRTKVLSRKPIGGWGSFAVFYRIKTETGTISLANVHLDTPRPVLMEVIHRSFNLRHTKEIESNRQYEALLLALWSKNKEHTLIIGDFNMPMDENIYETNFSTLNNAIDVKGVGLNPTKYTFWHGVGIDHVLYSNDFELINVEVVNPFSGDHRPIISRFKMKD